MLQTYFWCTFVQLTLIKDSTSVKLKFILIGDYVRYSDKEGILLSVQKLRKIHQILFCRNAVCNFHGLNKLWREEYGNLRCNFRALCRILWVFKSFKTFSLSKRQKSFPIESAGTWLNVHLNGAAKEIFVIYLPIRCNILKGVDRNEPKIADGMYLPIQYGEHLQAMILHFSCLSLQLWVFGWLLA